MERKPDVVARHGADVASDHSLVLAKIRLKLCKAKRKDQRPPPINVQRLKEPQVKSAFQTEIRNRFAVLAKHPKEVDMQDFNEVLVETGKELLGPRRRKKEEWISEST